MNSVSTKNMNVFVLTFLILSILLLPTPFVCPVMLDSDPLCHITHQTQRLLSFPAFLKHTLMLGYFNTEATADPSTPGVFKGQVTRSVCVCVCVCGRGLLKIILVFF